jgi:hypothetical protein
MTSAVESPGVRNMVSHGIVSPEWKPLVTLLEHILSRLQEDLAHQDPVCLSLIAGHTGTHDGPGLVRLAAVGEGAGLVEAQIEQFGGPVPDAVGAGLPIVTPDVWADARWPALTRQAMVERDPELHRSWQRIAGMAVVPAEWDDGGVLAVCCCLTGPADETTAGILGRYERLAAAALAVAVATSTDGPGQVLDMLQARAIIEQAKGALMAATRCDADTAFH